MFDYEEDFTPEELADRQRKERIRRAIIILVVVAMIATLLVPVIVRVVRVPPEPERIIALIDSPSDSAA